MENTSKIIAKTRKMLEIVKKIWKSLITVIYYLKPLMFKITTLILEGQNKNIRNDHINLRNDHINLRKEVRCGK